MAVAMNFLYPKTYYRQSKSTCLKQGYFRFVQEMPFLYFSVVAFPAHGGSRLLFFLQTKRKTSGTYQERRSLGFFFSFQQKQQFFALIFPGQYMNFRGLGKKP